MRRGLITIGLLLLCTSVRADDGAVHGVGGSVALLEAHPSIRMVWERVDVKLGWETAKVRCRFIFRNEGPATTVKIGFPEKAWGEGSTATSNFKNFKSWVDGKQIKTRFITSARDNDREYKAWHVKTVAFKARETIEIVDEYESQLGNISDGSRFFEYTLRSGKSWKGPIGKAIIVVDGTDISSYWKLKAYGEEYKPVVRDSKITWTIKNFEPEDDIFVNLVPKWIVSINGPISIDSPERFVRDHIAMARVGSLDRFRSIDISWNQKRRECTVTHGRHSILLRPGSRRAVVDGSKRVLLPNAPYVTEGTIIVPISTIAKNIGLTVTYDAKKGLINIFESK